MTILTNTGGVAATNAYLVEDAGECVLIDAPDHTVAPLLAEAKRRGWRLAGFWLTHGHFDHLAGHPAVGGVPAAAHRLELPLLSDPRAQLDAFEAASGARVPLDIPPLVPARLLEDGDGLRVGGATAAVLHTPGHSPGHVCFHFADANVLVGGDLIIGGAVGRTDLPGCDPAALAQSVRRVMTLPPETRLLPGHGGPSTLADEARDNPFVIEFTRRSP